jgi:tetraacyldisaccharide 4'-kinase
MGGAGKTPMVMALVKLLQNMGHTPHILSRGYGGYYRNVAQVDKDTHSYLQVGDEPLLLANVAPTWIGADRVQTAKAAIKAGATVLIMDDGLQNPSLYKDFSIVVVDALQGLGNQKVFPAGPLREPLAKGLKRANLVVIVGEGNPLPSVFHDYVQASIVCDNKALPSAVVAFAGIGYPAKFKRSLALKNIHVHAFVEFADHYPYTIKDMEKLVRLAKIHGAPLLTTEKDYLRVPPAYRFLVKTLKIHLELDDADTLIKPLQIALAKN